MSSVGTYLRGLREKQGMSVDELSRATRVLHHYLEALEGDNILSLPAPVFTKGFIRAYCQAVGVPPEQALKLYDRLGVPVPDVGKVPAGVPRVAAREMRRPIVDEPDYLPVTPVGPPTQGEPREKRRGTALISFVLLVVLGTAFFAVTLALQSGRDGEGEPTAQAPVRDMPAAPDNPVPSPVSAPIAERRDECAGGGKRACFERLGAAREPGPARPAGGHCSCHAERAGRAQAASRSQAAGRAQRRRHTRGRGHLRYAPHGEHHRTAAGGRARDRLRASHAGTGLDSRRPRARIAVSVDRSHDGDDVDTRADRGRPDQ